MTTCDVKGVACWSYSAQLCGLFSSLFWFYSRNVTGLLSLFSSTQFLAAGSSCFEWKSSDKPTVHNLHSTKHRTDKVSDSLVNKMEHLDAEDI